ncbi:MAG: DUF885 domain-containing protein, partial [Candidatus Dormibacteria bacterium]
GLVFQSVPAAPLPDAAAVDGYLERLKALPAYFDAVGERYREATARGRRSTRVGVLQAIEQLDGHLAQPLDADVLVRTRLPATVDGTRLRAKIAELVDSGVRPAERRLRETLEQELLPRARSDDEVGICFVPGGEEGYRDAVRRHTTTRLTAAEIHQRGRDRIAGLEDEWSELGARVLGVTDGSEVRRRLREDPNLRFHDAAEIVGMVGGALERAEGSRNRWFPSYRLPQCVIEEISPLEAGNAPLAYYRPPSADGSRPAAHCVLTSSPEERFVYEYEALAFHESSPGHHLQIAVAQGLTELPRYRRHLDAEACAFIEGWGLYSERLSDEMGLYSSDLQRLGMLSFDALRAARLVVDTGMHHFGWSRQRAIDYLWENTATPRSNVENEIHRYISWPGQALAYMVGCGEIRRLRELGEQQLGSRFDIRGFHGAVLGSGAVPLGVLEGIVQRWIETLKVTG